MDKKQGSERSEKKYLWSTIGVALVLILMLGFSWRTVVLTDRKMRADLLRQTRMAAQAVDVTRIRNLSGTTADLNNPDYLRIKEQLAAIRAADPHCRFVFLMKRRTDGMIFFSVDSEPPDSGGYSPPGDEYPNASEEFQRIFDTCQEVVVGPVSDQWGKLITALIPLTDPRTGTLAAVMGLDIDARTWSRNVAVAAALPVGLILLLLISVAGFSFWQHRKKHYYRMLRQSAEDLKKSEDLLSATLRSIGDGVIACDAAGDIINLNNMAEKLTGWSSEEAQGHPIAEVFCIIHSQTREEAEIPVARALVENRTIELANHTALIARDGTERQIADSCAPIHDASGTVIGTVLVFRDVTEAYQQREQLRESEIRLRAITDSAQDAIIMMNPRGLISYWNPAAETIFGYPRGEAMGKNLHTLLTDPNAQKAHLAAFPEFQRTGHGNAIGKTLELMARCKDGREISVDLSLSAVSLNHEWHAVGIVRDITERKQTEVQLKEANIRLMKATVQANEMTAQAKAANSAKSVFLANMSHEIRTPMNAVIGMTDLLMETELNPEQREFTNIVRVSGEALLSLINDVLDFSKIEAGRMEIDEQDFDLIRCVEDTLDLMVSKAAEKDIELTCEIGSDVPPVVRGDAGRLRQILLNLLSNALKFTHQGEVGVSVTGKPSGAKYQLTFSVRDTGIGIEQDKLGSIFESFTQADASTTRQYGGTGLGLTISRRLSELMGGGMRAESLPGEGSVFYFTIEVAAARRVKTVRADQKPFSVDLRDVLIVDDNQTNLKILSAQLTRWGLIPVVFNDPAAALQSIRDGQNYILMITDMQMPVIDGAMLIKKIRKYRPAVELPVIVLTSIGIEKPETALDISSYLVKPVKPAMLYQNIANILHGEGGNYTEMVAVSSAQAAASPLALLVVEDNQLNQKVALRMLSKLGYNADLARDGVEALEMIGAKAYDIILMDVQMPRMDGLTATRKIIQQFAGKKCPVIIGMTAHAASEERNRGLSAGMDDYLIKPIQLVKLKDMLWKIQEQISEQHDKQ